MGAASGTAFIYDARFLAHETGLHHPETPGRLEVIHQALSGDARLWAALEHRAPSPASREDLSRCHSARLIDEVADIAARGGGALDADTPMSAASFDVACLAAGAGLLGVDQVVGGEVTRAFAAVRPPGHHSRPGQAMGFCLFNNVAIAARYAQSRYHVGRVLIVDWDVHHGNGTQEIFYSDPSVYFFSVHQYPWYPGTGAGGERGAGAGEGTTLNIPLAGGTPAARHRDAFRDGLRKIEEAFAPELVLISAGFDSRRDDPLGGLLLEEADFAGMTLEVMALADRHAAGRVVSILEGGYNLRNLGASVAAHVSALAGGGSDLHSGDDDGDDARSGL